MPETPPRRFGPPPAGINRVLAEASAPAEDLPPGALAATPPTVDRLRAELRRREAASSALPDDEPVRTTIHRLAYEAVEQQAAQRATTTDVVLRELIYAGFHLLAATNAGYRLPEPVGRQPVDIPASLAEFGASLTPQQRAEWLAAMEAVEGTDCERHATWRDCAVAGCPPPPPDERDEDTPPGGLSATGPAAQPDPGTTAPPAAQDGAQPADGPVCPHHTDPRACALAQDAERYGARAWDRRVIDGLLANLDGLLDATDRQPGDRCRSTTGDHLRALLAERDRLEDAARVHNRLYLQAVAERRAEHAEPADNLDAIEARATAATRGPWEWDRPGIAAAQGLLPPGLARQVAALLAERDQQEDAANLGAGSTPGPEPADDLAAVEREWLVQCGPCDFGMSEHGCQCPSGDFRPPMARLVARVRQAEAELERWRAAEVKRLSSQLAAVRTWQRQREQDRRDGAADALDYAAVLPNCRDDAQLLSQMAASVRSGDLIIPTTDTEESDHDDH